jgi:hypothetical protein
VASYSMVQKYFLSDTVTMCPHWNTGHRKPIRNFKISLLAISGTEYINRGVKAFYIQL